MKICPECRLGNLDSAQWCDCGYDFNLGQVAEHISHEDHLSFADKDSTESPSTTQIGWGARARSWGWGIVIYLIFSLAFRRIAESLPPKVHVAIQLVLALLMISCAFWPGRKSDSRQPRRFRR